MMTVMVCRECGREVWGRESSKLCGKCAAGVPKTPQIRASQAFENARPVRDVIGVPKTHDFRTGKEAGGVCAVRPSRVEKQIELPTS
jgi:ribosomal protein L37E